jgi:cyclopropane fatty-acyl-phospholipid synthase-like methyltransferase
MNHVINSFFPPQTSANILDLGCGHGVLVYFARRKGYRNIRGVDVSAQQVALARELGIEHIVQGSLKEALMSTPLSSQDAVVTFDVIEHFTKDELIEVVDAVYSVIKPGGRWIIHAPNGASPFVGAVRYGDFTHEQAFTPSSLQQLLRSSRFVRVDFFECAPRVHGIKSLARAVLWSMMRLAFRLALAAETGDVGRNAVLTRNLYAVGWK